MLNLVDCLFQRGQRLQTLGRTTDARYIFGRLASLKELPTQVAQESAARLGEIELGQRRYRQARRRFAAAIAHQPENARYHYLMARALDLDEDGDLARAYEHYQRSLELDPNQPECLSDSGLAALCLGDTEEGLRALRRAVDLSPDDPEIVGKLVEGLCEAEKADEARAVLRAARFRNPRDLRFTKLWDDFQFQQLRAKQEAERASRRSRESSGYAIILPFVHPAPGSAPSPALRKRIRKDGASFPNPPHIPRPSGMRDRKPA
jgi:tetratricopeptide (TPR) repeat protein